MKERKTDLSSFDNKWFHPGASLLKWSLWYFCNALFFLNPLSVWSRGKCFLLRLFGAKIGRGVVLKPRVNIKYPWRLEIGDYAWIGEGVWIENHMSVKIGSHCCLSQGVFLTTGNHDYSLPQFDLIVREIILEDGVWLGAKSIVCPGVNAGTHAVLTVQSVATKNLLPWTIYQGNPAVEIRKREMK